MFLQVLRISGNSNLEHDLSFLQILENILFSFKDICFKSLLEVICCNKSGNLAEESITFIL